nr:protein FAR-RED ELONGATED HYPOCOTYL 3 isoform X2 [Ipomoea batatas]
MEFFILMQSMNSNFFYAVDVSEDHRLKNFLWVDAKSRHDYAHFSDVVSFDATYIRNKYKIPHYEFVYKIPHYEFVLLGTALLSDESSATLSWVMRTWLRAMGGEAPKAIVTDHEQAMTSVISEIFPSSLHFFIFFLYWKGLKKCENVVKQNEEEFMVKFEECIYRAWTDEELEEMWQNLVDMFELKENELFLSLYEEEAKADLNTWNEQPILKTSSPFEKHMAGHFYHPTTICHEKMDKIKDAKNRYPLLAAFGENKSRVQRYNDLCQRAMVLSEEAKDH